MRADTFTNGFTEQELAVGAIEQLRCSVAFVRDAARPNQTNGGSDDAYGEMTRRSHDAEHEASPRDSGPACGGLFVSYDPIPRITHSVSHLLPSRVCVPTMLIVIPTRP